MKTLRVLRALAGISQRELAEAVGVTGAYVSLVELGHSRPTPEMRERLIAEVAAHLD